MACRPSKFRGLVNLAEDSNSPKSFGPGNDYDVVDHVSYLRGKHAFKFGGEILTYTAYDAQYNAGRGIFNFKGKATVGGVPLNPLESFLAGLLTRAKVHSCLRAPPIVRSLSRTIPASSKTPGVLPRN